jgi:transcription termination/antitermination protein NusG
MEVFANTQWYAVHTRSRHERKVRDELLRREFEVFFPEYRAWSRRTDRRKEILRALFSGYLFVRTEMLPKQRLDILKTPSVVRIVGTGYKPVPVPEHQVNSIRLLLQLSPDAGPHALVEKGQLVQVMEGPLRGVVGVVESSPQKKKIVVSVDLLGRAVSATLDTDAVSPYLDGNGA